MKRKAKLESFLSSKTKAITWLVYLRLLHLKIH